MIIMDVIANNLLAFKNFHINMSYPKKIVNPQIENEFLVDRPNFRYKKVNIIMGSNATGKTSLGKLLMCFTNYLEDGSFSRFTSIIADKKKKANLQIDFVLSDNNLYRLSFFANPVKEKQYQEKDIKIDINFVPIKEKDNYETCSDLLNNNKGEATTYGAINSGGWSFLYPADSIIDKRYMTIEKDGRYLHILEKVLKTLDPAIKNIKKLSIPNSYAICWENCQTIVQDGKILNSEIMSSGTKAGLDISYVITSLICDMHDLYYCDELFSYVNSDVEKACLSMIIDKMKDRKQLFFTTHNTEILEMQLPKHSFIFFKKDINESFINCIYASDYLKRNTDSLKCAVENDLFCTAPSLENIYSLLEINCPEDN